MKKIMSFLIIAAMLVTIAVPFALAAPRDKSYEWLTTMSFYHMEPIGDDVILAEDYNGKYCLFSYDGTQLCELKYDYISRVGKDRYIAQLGDEMISLGADGQPTGFSTENYVMSWGDDVIVVADVENGDFEPNTYSGTIYVYSYDGTLISTLDSGIHFDKTGYYPTYYFNGLMLYRDAESMLYGAIDYYGNIKIEPQYEEMTGFANGYAVAKKDGKYGIIDTENNVKVDFTYDNITMLYVSDEWLEWYALEEAKQVYLIYEDNKVGVMSTENFEILLPLQNNAIDRVYLESKRVIVKTSKNENDILGTYEQALLDFDGNTVVDFGEYTFTGEYSEGCFTVSEANKGGISKMGIIDADGNVVVPVKYHGVKGFSEGLCYVYDTDNEFNRTMSAFLDKEGNKVIVLDMGEYAVSSFNEGLAVIEGDGLLCHVIDKYGNIVMACGGEGQTGFQKWYHVYPVKNGVTIVTSSFDARVRGPFGLVRYTGNEMSEWAKDEVANAQQAGIIPEHLQGLYKSDITREEFCEAAMALVSEKLGMDAEEIIKNQDKNISVGFSDTDNDAVLLAALLGIVNGRPDGTFDPDGTISRQEAAAMLYRTASVLGYDTSINEEYAVFSDEDIFADYAADAIKYVSSTDDKGSGKMVMMGVGNNMFSPDGKYTREQSYATLYRLFNAAQ